MLPFASPALELKRRTASDVIPGWIVGLLGGLQVVLWLAIMICEGVNVRYDAYHGTIYAGFWCSTIFFTTWISMFCFLCCGKANCCGIYLIVMTTIAFCFSIILVAFTYIFVNDPCKCYGSYCENFSRLTCLDILTREKAPYLKGLLACSVLMLLTNFAYIITYIVVSIWLCKRGNEDMDKMNAMFVNRSAQLEFAHPQPHHYPPYPSYPMNYPPQMGGPQYAPYLVNDAYRQPSPKYPTSQPQTQPPKNDDVDEGRM